MWETWVRSLGWEDPLEKGKAIHSRVLAWNGLYSPWGHKESDMTEKLSLSHGFTNRAVINIYKCGPWYILSISRNKALGSEVFYYHIFDQ